MSRLDTLEQEIADALAADDKRYAPVKPKPHDWAAIMRTLDIGQLYGSIRNGFSAECRNAAIAEWNKRHPKFMIADASELPHTYTGEVT